MVQRWPDAIFFNLAWEEIFYQGHNQLKAPADVFTKTQVYHHAWGNFYRDYLVHYGVNPGNIFVNGNPVYQLFLPPYANYYAGREELAKAYGLDPVKQWVFIPENYRWAFIGDETLRWRLSQGANLNELLKMREYAQLSLRHLLSWCNKLAQHKEVEVIFRPKPATHLNDMRAFFQRNIPEIPARNLHFIKEQSVREWILASDITASSFSTTLIEASIAKKPILMVEPLPLTEAFKADWYSHVAQARNQDEFIIACLNSAQCSPERLNRWAREAMLSQGDPICSLAGVLGNLAADPSVAKLLTAAGSLGEPRQYWDPRTHEHDGFGEKEVQDRIRKWDSVLKLNDRPTAAAVSLPNLG